ncbi:hypothetical protein Nepgr_028826 [Nepenthes gracilis]|uniref:Uncharacterized protein n=1 Tax=Nepenthes gracilis TaxID=150966 RepID=A0AAD3Y2R4_NEPGR|nr:hypothetical protein Nepgr_028826 [Nepenthes gracilis]
MRFLSKISSHTYSLVEADDSHLSRKMPSSAKAATRSPWEEHFQKDIEFYESVVSFQIGSQYKGEDPGNASTPICDEVIISTPPQHESPTTPILNSESPPLSRESGTMNTESKENTVTPPASDEFAYSSSKSV